MGVSSASQPKVEVLGVRQEKRDPIPVTAGEPSNGFGERRGVNPPVLHTPTSATIFGVPTGGLTALRSLELGRETRGSVFSCPPP